MKKALNILTVLVVISGCRTNNTTLVSPKDYLVEGTYYLNFKNSNDTLRFQSEIYDKGNWNNRSWSITKDSIFQKDSRGLSYVFGKDRRKYILSNDTLYLWTNLKKDQVQEQNIERYLVLRSDKKQLELIDLNFRKVLDKSNEIKSDIQLR